MPQEVLGMMHAPPKASDVPVIQAGQLAEADGILFGIPTRFGVMPAQLKSKFFFNLSFVCLKNILFFSSALFDSCGQLWMKGAL